MADARDRRKTLERLLGLLRWRPALRLSIRWPRVGGWRPRLRKRPYARPAISYLTDARPAVDPFRVRGVPPEEGLRARLRLGSIVAGLASVFVFGLVISIFGTHGYRDVCESRRQLGDLEERLGAEEDRVTELKKEVQRLKEDPAAIERIARETLGLAKPKEFTFLLPKSEEEDLSVRPAVVPGAGVGGAVDPGGKGGQGGGPPPG